ncbi:anti-sigma factor domain-containing protein [Microbacterium sp. RU33B]|uniref:anti-sigma factor domain-containing protein n=1 Tax=Microbacterium sp. RU33B TaxID=1907390 RepID=UPI000960A7AB|nr:anti-sigma factor [Microbacterium sp. RU33B]SIT69179.1 Anti-sigma-K factor rskA [Microbacterium sp. RU33B]
MSHLDPEQLALIALGEPVASTEERAHLVACPACAADVAEMAHAVGVARSTIDEAELEAPPVRVWSSIVDELALGGDVAGDPFAVAEPIADSTPEPASDSASSASGEPSAESSSGAVPEPGSEAAIGGSSRRTRRDRARGRRPRTSRIMWVLAASLAVVFAIGAGTWITAANLRPLSVATAALDAFPDHPAAVGSAEVDEARDGRRTLRVSLDGTDDSDDYREVWLIRNDGAALISLGVLEGTSGSFPIPDGVDLSEYDLVDISLEPIDGDPGHSGDSIVRGQLTSV